MITVQLPTHFFFPIFPYFSLCFPFFLGIAPAPRLSINLHQSPTLLSTVTYAITLWPYGQSQVLSHPHGCHPSKWWSTPLLRAQISLTLSFTWIDKAIPDRLTVQSSGQDIFTASPLPQSTTMVRVRRAILQNLIPSRPMVTYSLTSSSLPRHLRGHSGIVTTLQRQPSLTTPHRVSDHDQNPSPTPSEDIRSQPAGRNPEDGNPRSFRASRMTQRHRSYLNSPSSGLIELLWCSVLILWPQDLREYTSEIGGSCTLPSICGIRFAMPAEIIAVLLPWRRQGPLSWLLPLLGLWICFSRESHSHQTLR